MFSERLKKEQPFVTNLFTAAINSNKLAQAYLFDRAQPIVQYYFSLELAKVLNCSEKINNEPCNKCVDCKWISKNTHPAVITVSPVDYIPTKEDDIETKTRTKNIINVDHARLLQKNLASSSKYHRVIIFMGAKEEKLTQDIINSAWLDYRGIINPPEGNRERLTWIPQYLNYQSFPPATANILLKTIEEPLGKVLFIFITKDPDDMLSTIVSRCQVIPLLSRKETIIEESGNIKLIASFLPPQNDLDAVNISYKLIDFAKSEGINLEQLLEYVEIVYRKKLIANIERDMFSSKLIECINTIENTKNMLKNYVNPHAALISMLSKLIIQ